MTSSLVPRARPLGHALIDIAHAAPALVIAAGALLLTPHTPLRAIGPLTTALIAGIVARAWLDATRTRLGDRARRGLAHLAGPVLRGAVVISALRLDWIAIAEAGPAPWIVAALAIPVGMASFALGSRLLGVRTTLAALVAIGTSVCGAAAITVAAPRVRARQDDIDLAVAIVSVLGAVSALFMIGVRQLTGMGDELFALFTGGGLHEVAHVVAASDAAPAARDLAILTKLARVALLPVGIAALAWIRAPDHGAARSAGIPRLALACFAISLLGTLARVGLGEAALQQGWLGARDALLASAGVAFAGSMAAIGLRVPMATIRRGGARIVVLAVLGLVPVLAVVFAAAWFAGP